MNQSGVTCTNSRLSLSLAVLTGVNVIVAFANYGVVLAILGPGVETDALFAGATAAQLLLGVISGSLMNVLVPMLTTKDDQQFAQDAWSLLVVIGLLFAALAILFGCSSSLWIPLFFPGLSETGKSLAIQLARIQLVGMIFSAVAAALVAVHHARQRFLWPQYSHLIDSLLGLGLLAWALPTYGIELVASVSVLRPAVQAALLSPGLGPYRRVQWRNTIIREAWQRSKPLLLGASYYKSGPLVDRFLSSMVPAGGLSLFFFTHQVYAGLNDLINKAITIPLVPVLVRTAASSNWLEYRHLYRTRLLWVLTLTVLVYLAFLVTGESVATVLIGRGGVTVDNIELFWWIFFVMGGYLIAGALGQVLAAAFYADGDTKTPATVGIVGFTVGTLLKIVGFLHLGLVGLGIGATLHQLLNTIVLYVFLERKVSKSLPDIEPVVQNRQDSLISRYACKRIVPCPICDGDKFRTLASNDRYNMGLLTGSCYRCGLVMTNPVPTEEAMNDFYEHEYRRYYRKTEIPSRRYIEEFGLAKRARYTGRYLQGRKCLFKNARILDVGCSEGSILKEIKGREPSVEVVGIEPNVASAKFAREFLESKVYPTLADLRAARETVFDLIVVNHVLEHVENPLHLLTELKGLMAPGGSIYVDVPDLGAYTSLADLHIAHRYHFSIRTLIAAAHKAELRVAEIERHNPPRHPQSIRCLLKLDCTEPVLTEADLDDQPAFDRLVRISRWSDLYFVRQCFRSFLHGLRSRVHP